MEKRSNLDLNVYITPKYWNYHSKCCSNCNYMCEVNIQRHPNARNVVLWFTYVLFVEKMSQFCEFYLVHIKRKMQYYKIFTTKVSMHTFSQYVSVLCFWIELNAWNMLWFVVVTNSPRINHCTPRINHRIKRFSEIWSILGCI